MSSLNVQSEDDKFLLTFLENTFFKGFQYNIPNYNGVELFTGRQCNLKCKYCYLSKYGNDLYTCTEDFDTLVKNGKMLVDFLKNFNFRGRIDIFSGEPLLKDANFEIMRYTRKKLPKARIIVPTNMTFLFNEDKKKKVEDLLKLGKIILSASVDGKYLQNINRPYKLNNRIFSDKEWDEVFKFAKKWDVGFHPMIYSHGIEKWKDNFIWFIEMFKKYRIDLDHSLYLLEVRNPEWTKKQCLELEDFMHFLVSYTYNKICGKSTNKFIDFIFKRGGFNILSSPLSRIGRGIGCSIQSAMTVRVGDLAIVPCHRTAYKQFIAGYFISDGTKIKGLKAHNPYPYVAIMTTSVENLPFCESCPLKGICSGGCFGAQYEYFGDPFIPIPSVCMMEFAKYKGIFEGYKEVGMLNTILSLISKEKRRAIERFMEVIEK